MSNSNTQRSNTQKKISKKIVTKNAEKKITVHVPESVLKKALASSGVGLTGTVRKGLELLAAGDAYRGLRQLRGKVKFSIDLNALREDKR